MILDHTHRYVFIAVPKTGSISVHFTLGHGDNIPEPPLYHQSITTALQNHPECANYLKFGIIRNPWARTLSLYNDFTLKRIHQYSGQIRHDKPLFGEFANFEDFCVNVKNTPWINDIFLQSQTSLLELNGVPAMNYIGRFENLHEDFQTICKMIGVDVGPLQQHNTGKYDNSNHRQHYTAIARDAIAALYHDDIERYGYEF